MSRRNIRKFKTYREGSYKVENEPEEGEIVDDYDLIVSSDEELSMRQRIRELEAENEEIEQIAVISRSYVDKINHPHYHIESSRAAQVPTDASSISSTEFVTPKKRKRRKSREHKRKHCHRQHQHQHEHNNQYEQYLRYDEPQMPLKTRLKKSHCKRRQKLFAKKHKRVYSERVIHKDIKGDALSLESQESSESSSLTDTDNRLALKRKETINNEKYITRDTLRLAVARNTNESRLPFKKSCLKEKLQRQELASINGRNCFLERIDIREDNNDDDDDDVQVIENDPDIQIVDEDSTDSMEEKELRLIALKSAVLKKHLARKMRNAEAAYSPTDFDEMLSSGLLHQDNKLDDIDIDAEDSQTACVTISPEASPQLMMLDDQDESQQMVDCKPVDMDIANSDSEGATIDSWSKDVEPPFPKYSLDSHDFANKIQYRFYKQDLHELPPPPPGVDDYDNVPPPPPFHILYNAESLDMDLENEEFSEGQHRIAEKVEETLEDKQTYTDKHFFLPPVDRLKEEESDDEEEEEALRALLLSKFQSPKNQKKMIKPNDVSIEQDTSNKTDVGEQANFKPKPTEFILKEAVKRLKIHSQTEVCKEDILDKVSNKRKITTENEIQEYSENSSGSLVLFKKLTNRVDKYKDHHQLISTDQNKSNLDEALIKEMEEIDSNSNNNVCNQHTISNSLEVSSTIDISDITRRLQTIKENVLNLNYNPSPKDRPTNLNPALKFVGVSKSPNECFEVTEKCVKSNQSLENGFQLNKPLSNNLVNNVSVNNELDTAITNTKTVKANYDVSTNQTTFKVTIKNNASFKSEEYNDNTNTFNDVTYDENTNNESTSLPLKINGNTRRKVAVTNEKMVKATNYTAESNDKNNVQVIKTSSSNAKQIVNDIKVNPTPLYSFLRTTKIVKPNKVINANIELNLRHVPQANESLSVIKPSLSETSDQLPKVTDNSRLITSIDQVKHMCVVAPFVISIQNSSNESSDDELCKDCDSLYKPLYDYNDNASPLSLNLESPSRTPLRSNSPTEPSADGSTKHSNLEAFNLKTKIISLHTENIINKTPQTSLAVQDEKIKKTPLAVRHLPAAAQNEYRRLVHRMKLLETKRKLGEIKENKIESKAFTKNCCMSSPAPEDFSKEKDKTESMNFLLKTSLVKKVLLRNASNKTSASSTFITAEDTSTSSSKLHKGNVLRSYENLYIKFGAGIVNNLDKSLKLVEEAKKAKIEKLKLENRLKELKAEMDILQAKHKEEQQKISCIYPNICTTNEVITSLKQKRSKVFKAALNLGKSVKGEVYRLNNDLKETITTKSKQLATEIKIVNSLKAQDIKNIDDIINPNNTEKQAENKTDKIEDFKNESNGENIEIKLNPNKSIKNTMVCSGIRDKEEKKEEENHLESHLKTEFGGNTEFQSLEPNISKSHESIEDSCQLNKDTLTSTADSEKCSKQSLSSYISPLDHLRNIDSNMDPNGVVCPYDLMGNCEDNTCKYVHITAKVKT